jgi:hypothetical protein
MFVPAGISAISLFNLQADKDRDLRHITEYNVLNTAAPPPDIRVQISFLASGPCHAPERFSPTTILCQPCSSKLVCIEDAHTHADTQCEGAKRLF